MKKTIKPHAYCMEDEIHIIERNKFDIETKKYVKIEKMDDKFLITSPSTLAIIIALIIDTILLLYALSTQKIVFIFSSLYFAFFASLPFFNFIFKMISLKFGSAKWKQVAKVHAAMHMAINAFNEKGSTPTIEEMKKTSCIVNNCSCFSSLGNVICGILYFILSLFISNWIVILILYPNIFFFAHLFSSGGFLNKLQKLILTTPTDEELELVLEHLKTIDRFEKLFEYESYDSNESK